MNFGTQNAVFGFKNRGKSRESDKFAANAKILGFRKLVTFSRVSH